MSDTNSKEEHPDDKKFTEPQPEELLNDISEFIDKS